MKKASKTGRPKLPKGEAKTNVVRARVSPEEYDRVEGAAEGEGLTLSQWTRKTLLNAS